MQGRKCAIGDIISDIIKMKIFHFELLVFDAQWGKLEGWGWQVKTGDEAVDLHGEAEEGWHIWQGRTARLTESYDNISWPQL